MGKVYNEINDDLAAWIRHQKIFFVATAPLSQDGHINCSPKGLDSFRILDSRTVAYQDLTGSGVETIAHLKENGRIVIMFCAFDGPPKIVRLHGTGEVIEPAHEDFDTLAAHFPDRLGVRAYIRMTPERISDSCGYSIPLYDFKKDRDVLDKWAANKGKDGLVEYRKMKNTESIDGLTGLDNSRQ
jgi:hypothetical protein